MLKKITILFSLTLFSLNIKSQCTDVFDLGANVEICQGDNVTLNAGTGYDSYLWSNSSVNQSINVGQSGNYSCTVSKVNEAVNYVTNGDFENGNTSFTSSYTYYPIDDINGPNAAYGVINNPNTWFNPFSPCTDHTSGSGNMMVLDGAVSNNATTPFWCQTVSLDANTDYDVGYWITSVTGAPYANIRLEIDGVVVGTDLAPGTICQWQNNHYTWNSGASTSVQMCLYDLEQGGNGNDFAIDDIAIHPICTYTDMVSVNVSPIDTIFESETLCQGDSFLVNGVYQKTSGLYYEQETINSCLNYIEYNLTFSLIPNSNAGNDTTILEGSFINLMGSSNIIGSTFEWFSGTESISTNEMVEVQGLATQTYTLVATRNGCSSSDMVTINVLEGENELLFPTAFSPNNDGLNDVFRLVTNERVETIELKIYNRWGELIHAGNDDNHAWDGKYKRQDQANDLYIFVAKVKFVDQEEKMEMGNLSLIR